MLEIRGVRFDPARPVVIVPLTGVDLRELTDQAAAVRRAAPDVVEWRVDLAERLAGDLRGTVAAAHRLTDALGGIPLLVTVRTRPEGGRAPVDPDGHLDTLRALMDAGATDLVDVEMLQPGAHAAVAAAHEAGVAVVGSHHDLRSTPSRGEMVGVLRRMAGAGADVCKIAVTPQDPGDVLELLGATWTASRELDRPVVTVSMGALGGVSRVAGGVFGSAATFASVGRGSAPGQLDVATVRAALAALQPDGAGRERPGAGDWR
ncbi:type I 3-dehydroquinate dehydratase [Isoptericola sp. b490]|uniref:type I 3-dehydroquinate dehydratase n=1 Tax=Actinotalea lenta TaxID=3064654 RepID=UPI002712F95E|nr:type I 3-dehydroquinate dehydratase [Isoptericola sp. b490]MDO8121468.1 type I 3-dehydroquinate dehydratase [Isoptericola sp. b490]